MIKAHALPDAYYRLAVGSRVLGLLILGVPTVVLGDTSTLLGLVALGSIWLAATVSDLLGLSGILVTVVEAGLVGLVTGLSLDARLTLMAAIALPPFAAGLRRGVRGVSLSTGLTMLALLYVALGTEGPLTPQNASNTITWLLTGIGLGLIASYVHAGVDGSPDPLTPYREAQVLIRELIELSGNLRSGLDPITLATKIAVAVRNEVPVTAVGVHLPRQDALTPLVTSSSSSAVNTGALSDIAHRAVQAAETTVTDDAFALLLRSDVDTVAVVSGLLPSTATADRIDVRNRLTTLEPSLFTTTVQLDTALMFSRLRDAATTDERRRLAREMHDGVAQDIASLGYLVDALSAAPATPAQAEGLRRLRERITAVVSQVRMSVQTLRHDVEDAESLGAAIGGVARHLGESSGTPIRVTVNETTTRLRPEVEAELLRIAQESMNNAVRHAHATGIDVSIRVAAPAAEIVVRDDGRGLGAGRADSYGLAIMRERAQLIDADLFIEPAEPHGTVVTVRVPSKHRSSRRTPPTPTEKVTA